MTNTPTETLVAELRARATICEETGMAIQGKQGSHELLCAKYALHDAIATLTTQSARIAELEKLYETQTALSQLNHDACEEAERALHAAELHLADAVKAEREECAAIADGEPEWVGTRIARKIRQRGGV